MGIRGAVSALLFDFDGTIAETGPLWDHVIRQCFAARGFELDELALASLLTTPWCDVLPGLSPSVALAIEADIVTAIRPAYLECPQIPGLDVVLGHFSRVPKAIVTSSYREQLVIPYLRRHDLGRHFAVVIGAEDTEYLKPHPEPVLLAMRKLNVSDQDAWLIGDSPADIEAARSAGIRSVGIGNPAIGGDLFADSLKALCSVLATATTEDIHAAQ
jgi:beta-phosphoglucomutase-like phosphatase (HAD superfamily)